MNPISFLPKDEITPAIQNLGESLSKINESKIARKGEQIKSFQGLLDVSLQGVKNGHYGETTADLDKLTQDARDIYVKAENENRPVNYKESLELSNQKKSLLYKVNTSKMLMDDYVKTGIRMAELEKAGKLDPKSKIAYDNWLRDKTSIGETVFPSTLITTKLNEQEVSALLNVTAGKAKAVEDYIDTAKGHIDTKILTPQRIVDITSVTWDNSPELQRSISRTDYIKRGVDMFQQNNKSLTERVSSNTNVYAGGGFDPKFKPKYRITPEKEMFFNAKPNEGMIMTKPVTGVGTSNLESGDSFVPTKTVTEGGKKYLIGSRVRKNDIQSVSKAPDGTEIYTFKPGVAPETIKIPLNEVKTELESKYFNYSNKGEVDTSPWDMIGYNESQQNNVSSSPPKKTRMPIKDIRKNYPQYNNLTTKQLQQAYKDQFNIELY